MYTLNPRRRDDLVRLFEREFVESQEAVGIQLLGQFYDLDDPDRLVWLRGFHDMPARAESLAAFYDGPIWRAHREAANATMIDSDNVLLLRLPPGACGFSFNGAHRPPLGSRARQDGFVAVTIYYFGAPVDSEFIDYFENTISPVLAETGGTLLAYFVTEDSPNTFPRLPVREGENVFVWFAGFPDQKAYKHHLTKLRETEFWKAEVETFLKNYIQGKPEVLRLTPTPRSWLTGKVLNDCWALVSR